VLLFDEDGVKTVRREFTKEGLSYAMARINIRYKMLDRILSLACGRRPHVSAIVIVAPATPAATGAYGGASIETNPPRR
jgi:hypothetical protein